MGFLTLLVAVLLAIASASATAATPGVALAATPQFRHYNIDQGLPNSNVYTVVQDRHGVIWMGTITGLVRFDGTHFKVFRHIPGDASSLASDDVSSVLADSKGHLWAGGEKSGVNLYEPANGSFRHFKHDSHRADSLSGDDVMTMAEGRNGTLWVGTYGHGLDHMTSPGHFLHIVHKPGNPHSLVSNNVLSLYSRGHGKVWIGTDAGLDIREPDGSLRHVRFQGLKKSPAVWNINGNARQLRAATTKGLFVIGADGVARRMATHAMPHAIPLSSVRDHHGNLWVGTNRGLFLIQHGKATHFPARPLIPGAQPGKLIWSLMVDNEGGLWIATRNGGVAYLSPDWRNFSHYSHRPGDKNSLSDSHIQALASDGHGHLWVSGGINQLDKLDPATGAITHFGSELGPKSHVISAMARAGPDGLWLTYAQGLGLFDHGHLHTIKTPPPFGQQGVRRMTSNKTGTLYAAVIGKGAYRVNRHTFKVQRLKPAFVSHLDLQTSGLLIHNGHLWRSSHAGLSRLPANSLQLVPVPGVAKGDMESFTITGDNLWLVRPDGLEHYRLNHHHATLLHRVGAAAGWPGIVTYSMTIDKRGRVWMFAAAGLWRYNPATNRFRRYGKEDGLPNPEFTSRELVHMGTGTVFAGTLHGVIGFHPAKVNNHPRQPKLVIGSIRVRRNNRMIELPRNSHRLHLRWNDHDLRIDVQALSYINPKRNHYRFFLTGLDTSWVNTGTHGERELAGLKPGHYQLKVQAAGPSDDWSHLAAPLTIDVDAPPWLRPWAWVLYVLALLLAVFLIITAWRRRLEQRHRMQMARQQQRMAEKANAAKTRFLATLSHEIRTPMTGVLGMTELLLDANLGTRERNLVETIRRSGKLLLKLVNETLDMARIEAGRLALEPTPMDPRALVEEVRQLQSGQAQGKNLALSVHVDANMPACLEGDALRIKQILLNLSNNALKFTEHGCITIEASYVGGELVLCVGDTGPGISEDDRQRLFQRFEQADSPQRKEGSGLGLAICRELVALMHGRIELDTTLGKGSRFTVHLPLPEVTAETTGSAVTDIPNPGGVPASSLHLLLVEDDATVAQVIRGLMEAHGHHVTHAAHGLDALSEMENRHFDALLLDMNLPGMDGCQLARMIRQREKDGARLPIIAITARAGGDEEPLARAAGMNAFLRKPIDGRQLAKTLNELCQPGR